MHINSNKVSLELVNEEFPDTNTEPVESNNRQPPHREVAVIKLSPSLMPETDNVAIINDNMLSIIKMSMTTLIGEHAYLSQTY